MNSVLSITFTIFPDISPVSLSILTPSGRLGVTVNSHFELSHSGLIDTFSLSTNEYEDDGYDNTVILSTI